MARKTKKKSAVELESDSIVLSLDPMSMCSIYDEICGDTGRIVEHCDGIN